MGFDAKAEADILEAGKHEKSAESPPPYSPQAFNQMVVFSVSPSGEQAFSVLGETAVRITSKTLHYGAVNFEGAKVVAHEMEDGRHRLYLLHYDWNIARLQRGMQTWGFPGPSLTQDEHALALVNLLYANGWDALPILTLDGNFSPAKEMYVRPFIYFGESSNITLRNRHAFGFSLIVSPQPPYHGNGSKMALLSIPEPRSLPAPWEKRGDNYPNSMLWVKRMEDFVRWAQSAFPEIYVDGWKTFGRGYDRALEIIRSLKEILFRNKEGAVVEGSAENVGIIRGNRLLTPRIEDGCLPGFTMQKVELIAQDMGMEARRQAFDLEEFKRSDAPLLTGNAAGAVMPGWLVEAEWEAKGPGEYEPKGPVRITTLGTERGKEIFQKIKQEQEKIIAGKSHLGKFGAYADEFLSEQDIKNIREMTAEMLKRAERKIQAELFGKAPEGWKTQLYGGRKITYAERFGIK
ncbi:MAG: aminotransferase class IV [Candidatus Micrarchaeota archaeon]|nr:aminotransferase class IV [Candidatus Micrarchaeota archaeon]